MPRVSPAARPGRLPKRTPRRESEIVQATLQALRAYGIVCWRNQSGMVVGEHKGKPWVIRMGTTGVSDIVGFRKTDGRIVCVECKVPDRDPTPAQAAFLTSVTRADGLAFVARSLDDVKQHLHL